MMPIGLYCHLLTKSMPQVPLTCGSGLEPGRFEGIQRSREVPGLKPRPTGLPPLIDGGGGGAIEVGDFP
jgi:hypothetical protein